MKNLKLMFAAIMVAVVSMFTVSCSKSDDNNESRDTYSVAVSLQGGGFDTETLKAMEENTNKSGKDMFQNVTLLEASTTFYAFASKLETEFKKEFSGKFSEDFKVTLTLKDSKGNYVKSTDFTIKKGTIYG